MATPPKPPQWTIGKSGSQAAGQSAGRSTKARRDQADTASEVTVQFDNPPPQSAGVPMRLFTTGGPPNQERMNVAMRVLLDPIARNSFSRPYSGQRRNWGS